MAKDRSGEIFAHIHRAIDELTPNKDIIPTSMATVSWWNPDTNMGITLDLAAIFSKCALPAREMKICYRLMARYVIRGNRVGILAVALYMVGSLGVEGRYRKDLLEAVGGSSKKIMETIQTQRTRKIQAGSDAKVDNPDEDEQGD